MHEDGTFELNRSQQCTRYDIPIIHFKSAKKPYIPQPPTKAKCIRIYLHREETNNVHFHQNQWSWQKMRQQEAYHKPFQWFLEAHLGASYRRTCGTMPLCGRSKRVTLTGRTPITALIQPTLHPSSNFSDPHQIEINCNRNHEDSIGVGIEGSVYSGIRGLDFCWVFKKHFFWKWPCLHMHTISIWWKEKEIKKGNLAFNQKRQRVDHMRRMESGW